MAKFGQACLVMYFRGVLTDLYDRIWQKATQHPKAPAFCIQGKETPYAELLRRVGAIQQALGSSMMPADMPLVGVWTGDDLDTYATMLAAWSLRAAYVPINHTFPVERNLYMMETSGLRVLVARRMTPALEALLGSLHTPVQIIFSDLLPTADFFAAPQGTYQPDQLAYLLFTSGSTGRPKGVPITQGNLNRFFDTVLDPHLWQLGPDDRFVQMFELTFDLSVFSTFSPLLVGGCCCTVPEGGISYLQILDTMEEQRCSVALLVPSVLAYLHKYFDEIELPNLRLSLFCGEALPAQLAEAWRQRIPHARVENVYGPTEATIFCSRYVLTPQSPEQAHNGVAPIGQPMPGVITAQIGADGSLITHGGEGELLLAGEQVTPGYWQNPEKNAEAFLVVEGTRYYRTGDIVSIDVLGQLVYHGRTDQQVKIDGFRVELGEIEHHARELTGCDQLAVVATRTDSGNWQLHLFLENYPGETEGLRSALAAKLPAYMLPRTVQSLKVLPLNSNGKIDRPALRSLLG